MVLHRTWGRRNLNYFQTEQEAVDFAFKTITEDKSANRHTIGFLSDKNEEAELLRQLDQRNISYWTDQIPYGGIADPRYRVFSFGCDINQTTDLRNKYFKQDR